MNVTSFFLVFCLTIVVLGIVTSSASADTPTPTPTATPTPTPTATATPTPTDTPTPTPTATTVPAVTATPVPTPVVTGISPATGPITGGTVVTIYGSGFSNGAGASSVDEVLFGSTGSVSYTFISDSEITAPAPAEAAGTVNILVTAAGGTSAPSTADQFSYTESTDVPVPGFSGTPTSGTSPLTVQFTDASTGSPTTWNWTFGDGNTSTLEDPSYTYTTDGTYDVSLTETNDIGSNTTTLTGYIVVGTTGVPAADFSASATSGTAPLVVSFTDMSTGSPTTWAWDFGDGTSGADANPFHTYTTAGTYTVSLIATNAAGSNTAVKSDYITISGDTAATVTEDATSVQSTIPPSAPVAGYTYVLPSGTKQASASGSSSGGKSTAGSDAWVNEENQKMAAIDSEAPAAPQQTDIISSVVSFFESLFSWI